MRADEFLSYPVAIVRPDLRPRSQHEAGAAIAALPA